MEYEIEKGVVGLVYKRERIEKFKCGQKFGKTPEGFLTTKGMKVRLFALPEGVALQKLSPGLEWVTSGSIVIRKWKDGHSDKTPLRPVPKWLQAATDTTQVTEAAGENTSAVPSALTPFEGQANPGDDLDDLAVTSVPLNEPENFVEPPVPPTSVEGSATTPVVPGASEQDHEADEPASSPGDEPPEPSAAAKIPGGKSSSKSTAREIAKALLPTLSDDVRGGIETALLELVATTPTTNKKVYLELIGLLFEQLKTAGIVINPNRVFELSPTAPKPG